MVFSRLACCKLLAGCELVKGEANLHLLRNVAGGASFYHLGGDIIRKLMAVSRKLSAKHKAVFAQRRRGRRGSSGSVPLCDSAALREMVWVLIGFVVGRFC
jgi:hypothetical protein